MKKITFTLCLMLIGVFTSLTYAQNTWSSSKVSEKQKDVFVKRNIPLKSKVFSLDINQFQNKLSYAPIRGEYVGKSNFVIEIPDSNGSLVKYRIEEASVFAPEMQARYPEIRSYAGQGLNDSSSYLRFTVSPYNGVNGIVLTGDRSQSIIIQSVPGDVSKTAFFNRSDKVSGVSGAFECTTEDELAIDMDKVSDEDLSRAADDSILREYDLAMSVSAEFSQFHGNTLPSVNAAIATTVTRQNSLYEIDFAITFVLVANNDNVVYFTPGVPYSSTSDAAYNNTLQTTLTANIGEANYDIGHLMAGIGNNGNAGCIGCICVNGQKGSGYTTSTSPIGDTFDIDFVAHEFGHQFGGRHTFTHSSEGGGIAQMEPGSGSTIMGYAGITGATDVQSNSDPYFHAVSIAQITAHAKTRTCDSETGTGNNIPVVNAGANITLPIGTPFRLIGSATDGDAGDSLTYCWEQYDENDAASTYPDETSTDDNSVIFRSYNPMMTGTRTFPLMADLVSSGVNGSTWERVPTVNRDADFRLTVRDNRPGGAGNSFDDMRVTWDNTYGPFEVTSQNTAGLFYNVSEVIAVNWNVNNTTSLAGSTNVNILLSTDGGVTYPTTLASNVPNSGTANVTLPATEHQRCRILIEPTANQYFAINGEDFAIGFSVAIGTVCNTYNFNLNQTLATGATAFELFGGNIVGDSGIITDVNVQFDMTGLNSGMHMAMLAPDGTRGYLYNNACATGSNMQIVWDEESGSAIACGNDPTTGSATTTATEPLTLLNGLSSPKS